MSLDRSLGAGMTDSLATTSLETLGIDPDLQEPTAVRSAALSSAVTTHLLLRNPSSGANQLGVIRGNSAMTQQNLPVLDANWRPVAEADLNRDGQEDVLWRNSSTGAVQVWLVNDSNVQPLDLPPVSDLNWQTVGLGDFDRDGSLDILWQNIKTQEVGIWLLDTSRFRRGTTIGKADGSGWTVRGFADFDADSSLDLVWRNTRTGENALWLLNRTQIKQGLYLDSAPIEWTISAVGDFNGDRSPDLFWRNNRTQETGVWLYRNTQRSQAQLVRTIDANWRFVATGNLNQDQADDLLWQNSATGDVIAWLFESGRIGSAPVLARTQSQVMGALQQNVSTSEPPRNGNLTNNTLGTAENQAPSFSKRDRVDSNSTDFYRFSVGQSGIFTASLTGLTGDADVRLIQDSNGNGAIDTGEILAWQWERGTRDESIRRFIGAGTYFVQVYGYNNQAADFSLTTNFTAAASDDQQFRFELNFAESLAGLNSAARDAIAQAARFWESVITHRSGITRSNTLAIAITGENLTFSDGSPDTGTLAVAGPTFSIDSANNLIITRASATLNIRKFGEFNGNPLYLRDVMIHELAHALGFGTAWEPVEFTLSNGSRLTAGKRLIDRNSSTYLANTYAGAAYGDLLGSFAFTAVPIEPRIFAHWDETRFDSELMTPFAEGVGAPTPMSSLTLAALRDLGWNVNMGALQPYSLPTTAASSTATANQQAPRRAAYTAYKCACGRCLASVRTELSPRLSEAIGGDTA
jgi:hypothetical protein